MAVWTSSGNTMAGNLTKIPSEQKWVFHAIYQLAFPELYSNEVCSQNCFIITDEDEAEYRSFESVIETSKVFTRSKVLRWVARLGGSKINAINLILRLFLYHYLHTMSLWRHESIHNNTNKQQTPPPWWWSCLPLQRCGFNESTTSKWRAALLMFIPRPLLKGFGRINKLK